MFSKSLVICSSFVVSAFFASAAMAQEVCYRDYEVDVSRINASHDPELQATAAEIKKIQDAGLEPENYVVEFEGRLVPIVVKFYVLADRKSEALATSEAKAEDCASDVMPMRVAGDLATIYATNGLSLLLPEKMTRVDYAEIVKNGKPLGGSGAAIPKARDELLDRVGIRGDARIIIKDPKCIFGGC